MNKLYQGDNLTILRNMPDASVDLICTDPPFNTGKDWGAFSDKWEGGLKGYLKFMEPRLVECRRVLKDTGSLYLHCDPTASHYLKVMLDGVFGIKQFRNEIVWRRITGCKGNLKRGLDRNVDYILRYSKTDGFRWNSEECVIPYDFENLDDKTLNQYSRIEPKTNRRFALTDLTSADRNLKTNLTYEVMGIIRTWRWTKARMQSEIDKGRVIQTKKGNVPRYKRYLDEQKGRSLNTIWTDISNINPFAKERLGYPTQKPLALYERMIKASSNQHDIVLDPFAGSGTTLDAAESLGRHWIGIDIGETAIETIINRMRHRHGLEYDRDYHIRKSPCQQQ